MTGQDASPRAAKGLAAELPSERRPIRHKEKHLFVLALETSGHSAGAAVLRDGTLLAAEATQERERSAAALTPLVQRVAAGAGIALGEINLIAVTDGPGSFTGLRVGVTTAKTLAYALGCEVLAVDALRVIAEQSPADVDHCWAVIDAHRNQLFAARFERDPRGNWICRESTAIVDIDVWLTRLTADVHVCGPGLQRVLDQLPEHTPRVEAACWQPRAETVGVLALRDFAAGRRDDLWRLVPHYYRPSAAEEKKL
jgi:tRNA threonylcarbamoyladenosine biosynthesis protein TsaB